jgi:hypothetical protein
MSILISLFPLALHCVPFSGTVRTITHSAKRGMILGRRREILRRTAPWLSSPGPRKMVAAGPGGRSLKNEPREATPYPTGANCQRASVVSY